MTELIGEAELFKKLGALIAIGESAQTVQALEQGGLTLERGVKENIKKQKLIDLGNLRASIATAVQENIVYVFTNVVYAAIHEFGGTIQGKPWLMFQVGGEWRRVRQVTIPARPYFRPAIDDHRRAISEAVGDAIMKQIRRIV